MASKNPTETDEHRSQHRTGSWDHKQSRVIVYDPLNHDLSFEMEESLDKNYASFPVYLPRWRNRVNIYLDNEHKAGFVTSIDLGQLGLSKNLKRRLRYSYTVLHVKGAKPRMPSGTNTDLTASIRSN